MAEEEGQRQHLLTHAEGSISVMFGRGDMEKEEHKRQEIEGIPLFLRWR